jgi:hypothetical protein
MLNTKQTTMKHLLKDNIFYLLINLVLIIALANKTKLIHPVDTETYSERYSSFSNVNEIDKLYKDQYSSTEITE